MADRGYDIAYIKHGAIYGLQARALDIVRDFIIKHKRIIYGGMSIDMALKAAGGAGIYPPDEVPDYDFMSPDFYADSIELARILHAEGFPEVNSINATHVTSRRVRLGGDNVADITYIPIELYDRLPTIEYNGFRVIHPDFQRLDVHRALTLLLEKPPREVILQRAAKDMKRFKLLDNAYPIIANDVIWIGAKKLVRREFIYMDDCVVGGWLALAAALGYDVGRKGDKIWADVPADWPKFRCAIITDQPYAFAKTVGGKPVYYSRFLDSYHPRAIVCADHEIYDNLGMLIPYWTHSGIRFATMHSIALYMLLRSFVPPISSGKPETYRDFYAHCNKFLVDEPDRECNKLTLQMYGKYNWPLEYIQTMHKEREHVAHVPKWDVDTNPGGQNMPLVRPTTKLGWYPERNQAPEVIAESSELFTMTNGAVRPAFTAITP